MLVFWQLDCTYSCLYLALYRRQEALAFTSDDAERKGCSGVPKPDKRKLKGTPAAIIKWSASVWILTTTKWSHLLKLGLGRGRRVRGGDWGGKQRGTT